MLFGAVVDDAYAHLLPGSNPELGNAGAVELGTQAQLGVQAQVLAAGQLVTLWHTNTPMHSVAAGQKEYTKGRRPMNKTCGSCDKTDGVCYTSNPPKCRCKVTDEYHTYDHECDVEEKNVNKQDKPRICEVLGVEEDEVWEYPDLPSKYRFHNGIRQCSDTGTNGWCDCASESSLLEIINHPDRIIHKPRFTEKEIAFMRYLYRCGVKEIERPSECMRDVWAYAEKEGNGRRMWTLMPWCLPSLRPGQSVHLSEICGGED